MIMNSVDKLFKSKLEDHQLAPSTKAWEKLESNLSKKNRTIIWFRMAAVLALMGMLTVAVLNWNSSDENSPLTTTDQPVEGKEIEQKPPLPEKKNEELIKPGIEQTNKKKPIPTQLMTKPTENLAASEQVTEVVKKEELIDTSVASLKEEAIEPFAEEKKAIVLVYSLPTLPAKQTATTEVAQVEVEQTGIQKIWEAAKDVKNSDNPWGDLREVKNELLALDFKKDKNKNSNN
jgi:hypothetical protein